MKLQHKVDQEDQNLLKLTQKIQESASKTLREIVHAESQSLWLAFSGGVDSSVLLHVIFNLGFKPNLIHINHGFSKNSHAWAEHAQRVAEQYDLKIEIRSLKDLKDLKDQKPEEGESLEAWARDQRHQIFAEILSEGGALFLGHHGDDQAETLLLQLLRGAGPRGLSSMAEQKFLGKGKVLRPLLSISRLEIETYARFYQLSYVTDESNQDLRFKRNALRHEVLPILKQYFPGCLSTISRTARLCADESELLAELIDQKLLAVVNPAEPQCFYFKNSVFQESSPKMQRQLLRGWLGKILHRALNERHLREIEKLLTAEHWSQSKFEVSTGKNSRIRIFREKSCLRCIAI
jgi:tRNA(Ile)-lysidine synthase